jgi:hypothetical protein
MKMSMNNNPGEWTKIPEVEDNPETHPITPMHNNNN